MKRKKIFLICIIYCLFLQANAQTEFAPLGAEWYYTYDIGYNSKNHFNHVISEKDTIVDGYNCRVLRQYYEDSSFVSKEYIFKQEQGKIYYYYQNQFNLLFDFDAKVNDTIKFAAIYRIYNQDSMSVSYDTTYTDTIISARYRVESITINAQNLKTFRTEILNEDKTIIDHIYLYVEKIGLYYLTGSPLQRELIPMYDNLPHPAAEYFRWIRCYSDDNTSFVSDEWVAMSLPCNYPIISLAVDMPKEKDINIYPNPTNGQLTINNEQLTIKNVEIYDIVGQVVFTSAVSAMSPEMTIDINHLASGMYFLKVNEKTFKVIKN